MDLSETIDKSRIPEHIAIIMDGNGRWAKKKGALRIFGHQNAVKSVRDVIEAGTELAVKYITLYAFSTENWNRPKEEVNALMELLVSTLRSEINELHKNNIRLVTIGNIADLPKKCQQQLQESKDITAKNTGLTLVLALSYSGRWEIMEAIKKISIQVKEGLLLPEEINEEMVAMNLTTNTIPDPELLIRTSGEMRISNFLLWQIAYSELYITEVLWPDFRKKHLYEAIVDYQKRERRFGKTSEQIDSSRK
ncbi:MAG TPA: isoprenyl transferase [Cytophagaceae bacterium]|jgi:undecaprenyl diphosphate synthase|nr:isoprenyl transferase [Cytophagaceae bacterium]